MASKSFQSLRRSSDFEKIRNSGQRISANRWMTIGYRKNQLDNSRIGWTVSRKIGSAVIRNKLKRWCREYFRTVEEKLTQNLDINVVFKPVSAEFYKELTHSEFNSSLEKGWRALRKVT